MIRTDQARNDALAKAPVAAPALADALGHASAERSPRYVSYWPAKLASVPSSPLDRTAVDSRSPSSVR
jgi:hypothetical protein